MATTYWLPDSEISDLPFKKEQESQDTNRKMSDLPGDKPEAVLFVFLPPPHHPINIPLERPPFPFSLRLPFQNFPFPVNLRGVYPYPSSSLRLEGMLTSPTRLCLYITSWFVFSCFLVFTLSTFFKDRVKVQKDWIPNPALRLGAIWCLMACGLVVLVVKTLENKASLYFKQNCEIKFTSNICIAY